MIYWIGFATAWIILDLLGLNPVTWVSDKLDWFSNGIDDIFQYAYSYEEFGWTAIALRWFMLLSTLIVSASIIIHFYEKLEKQVKENNAIK